MKMILLLSIGLLLPLQEPSILGLSNEQILALHDEATLIASKFDSASQPKTWESGSHSVEAVIVGALSGNVELKLDSGEIVKIAVSKLSDSSKKQVDEYKFAERDIARFDKEHGISPTAIISIVRLVNENTRLKARVAELEGMPPIKSLELTGSPTQKSNKQTDQGLDVKFREDRIYILKGESDLEFLKSFVTIRYNGNDAVGGLYDVNGTPQEPTLVSSNPEVVKLSMVGDESLTGSVKNVEYESVTFLSTGVSKLTISLGKHSVEKTIEVVELPFKKSDSSTEVVKAFGFPTQKESFFTSWPESNNYDNIFCNPSATESIIAAEHWRYDKYPGLVVSIVRENVRAVGSHTKR